MTTPPRYVPVLPPVPNPRQISTTVNQIIANSIMTANVLPVEYFGAKGDGVADDSTAINAAFTYLRSLGSSAAGTFISFPRNYLVKTTINATSIRNETWGICGPGTITGQTNGTPIIDLSDSRYCMMRDITITGSTTNRANVGVLMAIISGGDVSDEHNFYNVSIDGEFTVSAFYNYGSEDFNGSDVICRNAYNSASAYCAVMTGYNSLAMTSPYKTLASSTATSFNDFYLIHGDFRKTVTGSPIFIERSAGLELASGYAVSVDSAAIVVNAADAYGNLDLDLDVHCETSGLTTCVRFDGAAAHNVLGFRFRDYAPQASSEIFKKGSSTTINLKNVNIDIESFGVSPTNHLFNATGNFALRGGMIRVPDVTHVNNLGLGVIFQFANGTSLLSGSWGINQASPAATLETLLTDANNAASTALIRISHLTSGTPSAGIGAGIEALVQTGAAAFKLGGSVDLVASNVTAGSEAFDWVFKNMVAGAAKAETFRMLSTGPCQVSRFTVAGLPTGLVGAIAFATNGRKNGEGAGSGTGVLVFHDGTSWCACDTGATVAA